MQRTRTALAAGRFVKLLLASPCGDEEGLERVTVRRIELKGSRSSLAVALPDARRHQEPGPGGEPPAAAAAACSAFRNAHLHTDTEELQFALSRKGRASLRANRVATEAAPAESHDKAKVRPLG